MKIQRCAYCDQPTGRCAEDSLYVVDAGPLCEECYDKAVEEVSVIKERDYD